MKMEWDLFGLLYPQLLCRDNDDDADDADDVDTDDIDADGGDDSDDTAAAAAKAAAAKAAADKANKNKKKTFTQEEVDRMIVKRNKALDQKHQQLEAQYKKALEDKNLTEANKKELESQLEELQNSRLSEKEKLDKERKKAEEKYQSDLGVVTAERDAYKERFEVTLKNRALLDAAVEHDAYSPNQIVELLSAKTKIVEVKDDDGVVSFVPKIEWEETTSEGQVLRLQKSPKEVVADMKEDVDRFGNLFKANIARGVGEGTGKATEKSGKINPAKLSTEEYMELRKTPEGRKRLGLTS